MEFLKTEAKAYLKGFVTDVLSDAEEILDGAQDFLNLALDSGKERLLDCHSWVRDNLWRDI